MSNYNSTATSTIYVNGQPAEAELQKLQKRASDLKDAIAAAAKAGDKASLKKLRSELNQTKREVKEVEGAMHAAEVVMKRLDKATPKELQATLRQLKKELNDMERGTDAWNKQIAKIKQVKAALDDVNDEMKEQQSLLSRLKDKINDWGLSIASAAAALTGLTMTARNAVQEFADLEEEMASVGKFTGMTDEQVKDLNEEFKKMDTRTSIEELNKLAQEAGRLGKSTKEDILGFVRAADQINVALDDLGDGATLTLSKIAGAFGYEEQYGTEQALIKVGSVINDLSQNCRASAPYIADFMQRLTATGLTARISAPDIMAYGAVLDSFGAQLESSATALGKLVTNLYKDPAKYAKAAGLEVQKFTELLKTDANEAVLTFLQALHNAGNLDALAPMLAEMGENGERSAKTMSLLAEKIDDVRMQQDAANSAFIKGTSIGVEYDRMNNTTQARLEKVRKAYHTMVVELGEKLVPVMKYAITGTSAMMKAMSWVVNTVIKYRAAIVSLIATFVAYKVAINAATIAKKVNAATTATLSSVTGTLQIVVQSLAVRYYTLTGNTLKAAAAQRALSAAMASTPWGAVIAVVGTLATAFIGLGSAAGKADEKVENLDESTKHLTFTESDHCKKLVEEKTRIQELVKVAEDDNASKEQRRKAISQLNAICPAYNGYLSAEGKLYRSNKAALDDYIVSLERRMRLLYYKDEYQKYLNEEEAARFKYVQTYGHAPDAPPEDLSNEPLTVTGPNGKQQINPKFLEKSDLRNMSRDEYLLYYYGGSYHDYQGVKNLRLQREAAVENILKKQYDSAKSAREKFESDVEKAGFSLSEIVTSDEPTYEPTFIPGGGGGGGGGTTKKTGKSGGSSSSSKTTDKFAAEKAWREREEALLKSSYALRTISLEEFNMKMLGIEKEFYTKQLEHKDLTGLEMVKIQAQYDEVLRKIIDKGYEQTLAEAEEAHKEALGAAAQRYVDGKSTYEQYTNEVEAIENMHLVNMATIYARLAKEDASYNAKKLEAEDKIRKKIIENMKKTEDEIAKKKKEHEDKLKKLKDEYFGLTDDEKQALYDETVAALDEVYKLELAKLGDNLEAKLKLEKKYAQAKKKIHDEIFKNEKDQGDQQMKNWEQWVEQWLDKIFGEGTWEQYGGVIKSAWSSLMTGYQALTKLVEAEEQEKLAAMTKKYDAELKAAEGNQYLVNQINKRKAAEEKKIKDEANKRAMAMEIAQAIATTSLGAINAYATTMKAPWPLNMVLAPFAAGLALAAGAIQIAVIRKQHQAQSQGYSGGGFTKPGAVDEVAGVVHAGEWVASQKLLASPVARPLIEALDYAQRTNTIGRLGSGGVGAAPVVMNESAELRAVIVRLNERLNEPFVTVNTVTGDYGIKKAMDDYNRLQNNTLPKNKRT